MIQGTPAILYYAGILTVTKRRYNQWGRTVSSTHAKKTPKYTDKKILPRPNMGKRENLFRNTKPQTTQ